MNKIIAVFLTLLVFSFPYRHYKYNFSDTYYMYTDEIEISRWVRNNTPKTSTFLVPTDFFAFRLNSERGVFIDWFLIPLSKNGIIEWRKRIDVINEDGNGLLSETELRNQYNLLSMKTIFNIKNKYGTDYMITENSYQTDLREIYRNKRYKLLSLR